LISIGERRGSDRGASVQTVNVGWGAEDSENLTSLRKQNATNQARAVKLAGIAHARK
jgi:hypothetical protein